MTRRALNLEAAAELANALANAKQAGPTATHCRSLFRRNPIPSSLTPTTIEDGSLRNVTRQDLARA
jgi:hypothetical protein